MTKQWIVRVIDYKTGEVVKVVECESERAAERVERGIQINLNHDTYYTEIVGATIVTKDKAFEQMREALEQIAQNSFNASVVASKALVAAKAVEPERQWQELSINHIGNLQRRHLYLSDDGYSIRGQWDFALAISAALREKNASTERKPLTKEDVRAAGGIVHSDGNVFFTSLAQLNAARAITSENGGQQ